MMPQRVVIFGGTGFIGLHVVRACLAAGYQVSVVVRPAGNGDYLLPFQDDITVLSGDFTVKSDVGRALTSATDVITLISSTVPVTAVNDSAHEIFATVLPYVQFLDVAVACRVRRVVLASSGGAIYGNPLHLPIPEEHPLSPITPYGIAKVTIEQYCGFYAHQFGLDTRVLRLANPYGPGQRVNAGQGIVGTTFLRVLESQPITVYGDGRISRDFVFVEDVADAFVRTLAYRGDERIFNIGSGEATELRDVLTLIEEVTGRPIERRSLPIRPFDVRANVLDCARARACLGWQPVTSFREGLRRTWEAILAQDQSRTIVDEGA